MYQQRTGLILFVVLSLGTILQGIGLFTQGWQISSSASQDYSTTLGLWSQTSCSSEECTSTTFYDIYKEAIERNTKSSKGVWYAAKVGPQIIGLLSFMCCLASSVLTFLIYRDHTHKKRMSLLVTCLLLVAETTESSASASYLDLLLFVSNGTLLTKLYDQRDDFDFRIVNFPFNSSNIPESPAYGVYISQLKTYTRACSSYDDFVSRGSLIWTIIGGTAAISAAYARTMDDYSTTVIGFPYSLLLSSVGSALSIFVALINFYTVWIDKQPPESNDSTCTVPYTQSPMQMNVQQNYSYQT